MLVASILFRLISSSSCPSTLVILFCTREPKKLFDPSCAYSQVAQLEWEQVLPRRPPTHLAGFKTTRNCTHFLGITSYSRSRVVNELSCHAAGEFQSSAIMKHNIGVPGGPTMLLDLYSKYILTGKKTLGGHHSTLAQRTFFPGVAGTSTSRWLLNIS